MPAESRLDVLPEGERHVNELRTASLRDELRLIGSSPNRAQFVAHGNRQTFGAWAVSDLTLEVTRNSPHSN
jgi:hypothetical protein